MSTDSVVILTVARAGCGSSVLIGETFGLMRTCPPGVCCQVIGFLSGPEEVMEAFFISLSAVAVAEIGDKTQLLALVLATRFRKPLPIIAGIFVATIVNHAMAAELGILISGWLTPQIMNWILAVSFIAAGIWMLIPDKLDDLDESAGSRFGPFVTTVIAFFLAEMGDKTQLATIGLAARFHDLVSVAAGTTLGMMVANVPAVILGDVAAKALPMQLVRGTAATIFIVLGLVTLLEAMGLV
ncbi:MAG: TMEM165/GDT1 family protein [Parvibaculaceae bacterium]